MRKISFIYTSSRHDDVIGWLPSIKSCGIDVVMNYACGRPTLPWGAGFTDEEMATYFDAFAEANVQIIFCLSSYVQKLNPDWTNISKYVNMFKDHPALYGWLHGGEWGATRTVKRTAYDFTKAIDPNHAVIEDFYATVSLGSYFANCLDIAAFQNYPFVVGESTSQAITRFNNFADLYITRVNAEGQPPGGMCTIFQCFSSNEPVMNWRLPASGELQRVHTELLNRIPNLNTAGTAWFIWENYNATRQGLSYGTPSQPSRTILRNDMLAVNAIYTRKNPLPQFFRSTF